MNVNDDIGISIDANELIRSYSTPSQKEKLENEHLFQNEMQKIEKIERGQHLDDSEGIEERHREKQRELEEKQRESE